MTIVGILKLSCIRISVLLDKLTHEKIYSLLKFRFGFNDFRHCQKSVIIASLMRKNCCVLMPTGAGKSLCYQLPAAITNGLTVVISPLLSLMSDQESKMKSLKVNRLICSSL